MSQNIQKQMENVVHGCASPCHSKRTDKINDAIDTSWKIYANTSFDDNPVKYPAVSRLLHGGLGNLFAYAGMGLQA